MNSYKKIAQGMSSIKSVMQMAFKYAGISNKGHRAGVRRLIEAAPGGAALNNILLKISQQIKCVQKNNYLPRWILKLKM